MPELAPEAKNANEAPSLEMMVSMLAGMVMEMQGELRNIAAHQATLERRMRKVEKRKTEGR